MTTKSLKNMICTIKGHRFDGWSKQPGYTPGEPLPFAHCGRCGREL